MSFDPAAALRRRKPERRTDRLEHRSAKVLKSVERLPEGIRIALIPDTNVYILEAAGRLPAAVSDLIDRGLPFHCSVCLAELATGIANADPSTPTWASMRDHYVELFKSMPSSRIQTPDAGVWMDAGLIAGALARTQRFQRHQRKECLNDALIYLTAAKAGIPVLTQDRDHFDLIQQMAPEGDFICF